MKVFQLLGLLLASWILLSYCSTQTDFVLRSDGSGEASLRVELSPILLRYYSDLATGFLPNYDPKHPRIFDLDALRLRFAQEKNLSLISARTPSPNRLEASFTFKNLGTLFADPKVGNVIFLERKAHEETIRIRMNRDTLKSILALAPETQSPMLRMLLPPENKPISEGEYHKQLVWALEEYGSEQELNATLQYSKIEVRIRTPAPILRQRGGVQEQATEVRFTLPLLTLLTTPVECELTYQR